MNKSPTTKLPTVTESEVRNKLPKTEAILLRLTADDKTAITKAAGALHLTATEYLVKCALMVAEKLPAK